MAVQAERAKALFEEQAISTVSPPQEWIRHIEELSKLCAAPGGANTHIAFIGTAMLAKAVDSEVDLYAIKPRHAPGNAHAYSARTLCHSVLVPLSAAHGVSIGVSGREPLNNQPYFRMNSLGDDTPVHGKARVAFDYMLGLVAQLQKGTSQEAADALRAYIAVRRKFQTVYQAAVGSVTVTAATLAQAIDVFVQTKSEGGRRAQAAVAGLFDVFAEPARVESGRINDPSQYYPGDVAVKDGNGGWEKAVEVRDKPVTESDVLIFARKCLETGIRECAVVLASSGQPQLDDDAIAAWAARTGIGITLFYGWPMLVDQVLFWAAPARVDGVSAAVANIEQRLIEVEASTEAVSLWHSLTLTR